MNRDTKAGVGGRREKKLLSFGRDALFKWPSPMLKTRMQTTAFFR